MDAVVKEVVAQVGDIPEDHVRRVLVALDVIKEGAPVGTVVRDAATGAIACRVSEDGVPFWRVTAMTGNQWIDMQPTLDGWTVLVDPEK
jgi:hypothetical protein